MNLTLGCPACSHPRKVEGGKPGQELVCLSCGATFAVPATPDQPARLIGPPKTPTDESVEALLRKARRGSPRASLLTDSDAQRYFKQSCLVILFAALVEYFNAPLAYPEGRLFTIAIVTAIAIVAAWRSSRVVYVAFMLLFGVSCGLGYHRDFERASQYGWLTVTDERSELFRMSRANPNEMPDERGVREIRLHRPVHLAPVDDSLTMKVLFNSSKEVTGSGVRMTMKDNDEPVELYAQSPRVYQENEPGPRSFGEHAPAGPRIRNLLRLAFHDSCVYATLDSATMKEHLHEPITVHAGIGTRVKRFNRSPDSNRTFDVVPVTREEFEQYRTWYSWMRLRGPFVNNIVVFVAACALCVIKSRRDKELPEYADEPAPDGDATQQIIATIRAQS